MLNNIKVYKTKGKMGTIQDFEIEMSEVIMKMDMKYGIQGMKI